MLLNDTHVVIYRLIMFDRTATFGLTNGGTAGAIYVYIFTFFGFGMAVISMAEMASMYENDRTPKKAADQVVRKVRPRPVGNTTGYRRLVGRFVDWTFLICM